MKYPPYAWVILVLASIVVSGCWFLAWYKTQPIVGYTVGAVVLLVPAIVGVFAIRDRRR